MAVVKKTSETRSRERAKATIRYIMHRPELGGKITRPLFTGEVGETQKLSAYQAIDQAPKGTRFLRIAISPDPKREDTYRDLNLRVLTRKTVQALAEKYTGQNVQFFAAEHAGHTEKRHVNLLVLVPPGRISKEDWKTLRSAATRNAREQRRTLDQDQERTIRSAQRAIYTRSVTLRSPAPVCPICREDLWRRGILLECHSCALSFSGGKYIGMQIERRRLELGQEVGGI
jgi:hypothetical protein